MRMYAANFSIWWRDLSAEATCDVGVGLDDRRDV